MESDPLDGEITRYMSPSIALFEVVEDDLLPIKPIGLQVKWRVIVEAKLDGSRRAGRNAGPSDKHDQNECVYRTGGG